MLDARMHARLTENYRDAAIGYANASAAALNACAQQAFDFWMAPLKPAAPAPRRDHLSWFNPTGSAGYGRAAPSQEFVNPWLALTPWALQPTPAPLQPPESASQLMAMAWAFTPFAVLWGSMRGPTFAWPMAYSLMAQGVPDSVAWPAAKANAAMVDAATTITDQTKQTFASYQSAGGFAMAHVWSGKETLAALSLLAPMMALWPVGGGQTGLF